MLPYLWAVRTYPAMLAIAGFVGAMLIACSLRRCSISPGRIGAILAIPIAARFARLGVAAFADLLAIPICFSMAVQRIGCFVAGCCFGTVSDVPWAVRFPERSRPWLSHVRDHVLSPYSSQSLGVHPLQLYFAVWSLGVVMVLLWLRSNHRRPAGITFLMFIVLNEAGKAVLERFRYPDVGVVRVDLPLMSATFVAAATLALALLVFARNPGWHASMPSTDVPRRDVS
jgi:phosphatidylglycerol:prolipoprotein diacylglycerol transferase